MPGGCADHGAQGRNLSRCWSTPLPLRPSAQPVSHPPRPSRGSCAKLPWPATRPSVPPHPTENFPIGREARRAPQPMPIGPVHREDDLPLAPEVVSLANDRPFRGGAEAPAPAWNDAAATRGSGLPPPGRLLRTFPGRPVPKAGTGTAGDSSLHSGSVVSITNPSSQVSSSAGRCAQIPSTSV